MTDEPILESDGGADWPANRPSLTPEELEARAASDRQAGFVISENFRRFSQRDDVFNRAWWDPEVMSDDVAAFYAAHRKPDPRKGDGYTQWDFALLNASWSVARDFAGRGMAKGRREGFLDPFEVFVPQAEQQAELPPVPEVTDRIRSVAAFLGADLVGVTAYDERWTYTHSADISSESRAEKPNDWLDGMTSVIVLGHEMERSLVQAYPSALAAAATGREYSHEAAIVTSLASFINGLGFRAVATSNDTALAIPYAIQAGLGEYGRNQMVITKEFGPRVRFSKVFTDLPLVHDKPTRFGVGETCNACTKCAEACPPKALPKGPPQEVGPDRSNVSGVTKWSADCNKCFTYWTKLRADCAICMRVCPYNRDYSKWRNRRFRDLLNGPLRGLMLWLDARFDINRRVAPKDWWRTASADSG
ncbi:MAG: reductive dehalogenase domain-containing protein [Alphaproteobacteria bacterium]|jgi:reductive dehalogenase|nr:reductive dehalogenase [Rhodospirillaceae bacterium]MDP6404569.1 reductive dehalogenase domain-containing protein [Alphaproteobacteria bacterium]|tara:strand:- start:192 stop:1448 length:1257 start_codon:yes stop_codon:yes gene_type:complete